MIAAAGSPVPVLKVTAQMADGLYVAVRVYGYRGYPPEQLRQLSLQQRYHDGEADAGRDQVQQGGLWTDRSLWTHQTDTSNLTPDDDDDDCP